MRNRSLLFIVLILAVLCFIGCSTTKAVQYTFVENETANGTATIDFSSTSYVFVDFEGKQLPTAETGTYWSPLQFPAGRDLNIRVSFARWRAGGYVAYQGIFKCPPLEAGKKYKLWYEESEKRLILTYANVKELKYFLGIKSAPRYRQIHVQETPTRDIPYTFAENQTARGTATIIFSDNIRFVDFEGEQLPTTEEFTLWSPLQFPAGRNLNVRVYILYRWRGNDNPGYRRRGFFNCPPLEAGKTYKLWYEPANKDYYSGAGRLILTYSDVTELKYFLGRPSYNQIYVQEIPPLSVPEATAE